MKEAMFAASNQSQTWTRLTAAAAENFTNEQTIILQKYEELKDPSGREQHSQCSKEQGGAKITAPPL